MKTNWQTKKLGEVCDISAGNSAPQKNEYFVDGVYPFFRTSDIGQIHIGRITEPSDFLNEEGIKGLKLFNKGTILLPKSGASTFLNHRVVLGIDGYVSSHLATVKTDEKVLNNNYLFYFLQEVKAQDLIQDHKYPSLNLPVIGNIEISYPESLPEQHRIVKILDEVFMDVVKAKENAEINLQNAKELFESYLQGLFENKGEGWEEKTLGEIFDIGSSKRIMEKDWTEDGVPFYGGKEIVKLAKFGFVVSNSYISEAKYNEYASKYDMPQHGDIMITARGTIGIGYIVKKGDKFYYKDGNIISMRAKMPTNPEFILYALKSSAIYDQLKKLTGATVSHLPIEKAKLLVLMTPNFTTQNTVVEKIQEIETETKKLEAIYQQKLNDLEELKKSVLRSAFAGEL